MNTKDTNIMYTNDGVAVVVVRTLDVGFLAKELYAEANEYLEMDDEDYAGMVTGDIVMYYEILHEKPITNILAREISELIKQKGELEDEIYKLKEEKSNEDALLNKVNKFPILKSLAQYLTGDFNYVVRLHSLTLTSKSNIYHDHNIRTGKLKKNNNFSLYIVRKDWCFDDKEDTEIVIFKTEQEASEFCKSELISKINVFRPNPNHYRNVHDIKNFLSNYRDCPLRSDVDVLQALDARIIEIEKHDKDGVEKEKQAKLLKLEEERQKLLNE